MVRFDVPAHPWRELPSNLDIFDLDQLNEWFETKIDRRTYDWPLMHSIYPTLIISVAYVLFVVIGNRVMKHFNPVPLKIAMIVYNAFVLSLNLWLFIGFVQEFRELGYGWVCNRVDYGPRGERLAWLIYIFYLSKALDFSDTIFMVLRKKAEQASFLHVYHHVLMFPIWWTAVRWCPGGDAIQGPLMNTFVHFVMYSYYLMSCFGVTIPGKHLLTQLQMSQLFGILVYSVASISLDCEFPHWTLQAQVLFMITLLYLFYKFYRSAYLTARDKRRAARGGQANTEANHKMKK